MENKIEILIRARNEAAATLKGVESQLGSLSGTVTKMFGAYVGWTAATAAIRAVRDAAMEEEMQWRKVTAAIQLRGKAVTEMLPGIKDMTAALQEQFGVADSLIADAFQRLTIANFDVAKSYEMIQLAMDITAVNGDNLVGTVETLIKGVNGSTVQLNKLAASLGINAEKAETAAQKIDLISNAVSGAAEAQLSDFTRGVNELSYAWENLLEAAGKPITDSGGAWAHDLTIVVKAATTTIDSLYYSLDKLGRLVIPWRFGSLFYKETWQGLTQGQQEAAEASKFLTDQWEKEAKQGERLRTNVDHLSWAIKGMPATGVSIPKALFGDDPSYPMELVDKYGILISDLNNLDFNKVKMSLSTMNREFDNLSDLPKISMDDIYGAGAEEDARIAHEAHRYMQMDWRETQRAAEESARAQERAVDQVAGSIQNVLSPLNDWLLYGKSIGDAFEDMGKRILETILNQIMAAIAEAIAQAIILRTELGKAQVPGVGGGGGGFGGFLGTILGTGIALFDDQENDRRLVTESRRMGRLVTEGFRDGVNHATSPVMAAASGGGTTVINHNYYGVTSDDFMTGQVFPKLSLASKRKQVNLTATTSEKFGRSRVLS